VAAAGVTENDGGQRRPGRERSECIPDMLSGSEGRLARRGWKATLLVVDAVPICGLVSRDRQVIRRVRTPGQEVAVDEEHP